MHLREFEQHRLVLPASIFGTVIAHLNGVFDIAAGQPGRDVNHQINSVDHAATDHFPRETLAGLHDAKTLEEERLVARTAKLRSKQDTLEEKARESKKRIQALKRKQKAVLTRQVRQAQARLNAHERC